MIPQSDVSRRSVNFPIVTFLFDQIIFYWKKLETPTTAMRRPDE